MKVSVLVPIYGVEKYIAKCAKGLMQQSYKDVEYIFVNDCTPDDSIDSLMEVIDEYPERKSQVIIVNHTQNMGVAMARQTGLNAATGDAVVFVDSDDYVAPNMIEYLVDEMQRSGSSIVDGGYGIVTNGVVTQSRMPLHLSDKAYLRTILCQNVEPNRIWGRLIKRSVFDDNNIQFYQGIDYSEDFSVMPRLLINARRSWVDQCLYYYRNDNAQSYTNNITTRNATSYFKAQELIGNFMLSHSSWKDYSFAAQLGWVAVWRFARRFQIDKSLAEENFTLKSHHFITRYLEKLMRSDVVPFGFANFIYMTIRRIYLMFLSL